MRSNTSLVNELGDDLALAFLVDKKFVEKCSPENAVDLIARVRGILSETQNAVPAVPAAVSADKTEGSPVF